jgi:phenylacetic acid degradation operon negative regulatory protein
MELRDDSRPLTARSVVASTLLGVRPPSLPVRSLVASAELFGVAEGTVRTALSRMVAAGELVMDDGRYALAGRFLARRERQDESRAGDTLPWAGDWELAVIEGAAPSR